MRNGVKCASVFIGTVIGAGFATGREVALFFKDCSPFTGLVAGLILGAFCAFFMYIGYEIKQPKLDNFLLRKKPKIVDAIIFICAYITFIAMFSGAEAIVMQIFSIPLAGLMTAVIAISIAVLGLKQIKILNMAVVPLIVALILVIYFKYKHFSASGNLTFLNPIAYSSLNIMLAGCIMVRLGATSTKREIASTGIMSGLILGTMLFMIQSIVRSNTQLSMPMYSVAQQLGIGKLAGVLIFFAILTTLVSAAELLISDLEQAVENRWLAGLVILACSWPICILFSFKQLVDTLYPIVSVFGVALVIVTTIRLAEKKCLSIINKKF